MWRNDALYLSKEGMSWRGIAKKKNYKFLNQLYQIFYAQNKIL